MEGICDNWKNVVIIVVVVLVYNFHANRQCIHIGVNDSGTHWELHPLPYMVCHGHLYYSKYYLSFQFQVDVCSKE